MTEAQKILMSPMLIKGLPASSQGRLKEEEEAVVLVGSRVGAGEFPYITLPPSGRS